MHSGRVRKGLPRPPVPCEVGIRRLTSPDEGALRSALVSFSPLSGVSESIHQGPQPAGGGLEVALHVVEVRGHVLPG